MRWAECTEGKCFINHGCKAMRIEVKFIKIVRRSLYKEALYDDKLPIYWKWRMYQCVVYETQPTILITINPNWRIMAVSRSTLGLLSVKYRDDWHKAFLTTVKLIILLRLTSTRGCSILGSLPVVTLIKHKYWKARMDQGCWLCAHKQHKIVRKTYIYKNKQALEII